MTTDHHDPHGQALLDYFNGETSATIVIHERGKQKEVPFLSSTLRLIKPDGQFLIDSTDGRPERRHGEVSGSGDSYSGAAHLQLEYSSPKCPIYIISLATYGHERIAQIVIVDKTQISIFHLRRRTSNHRIRRGGDS